MKKCLCVLLAVITVFSCFSFVAVAATPALQIEAAASKNCFKITWKYDSGATKFYVYVDGKRRMVEKQTEEEIYNYLFDFY